MVLTLSGGPRGTAVSPQEWHRYRTAVLITAAFVFAGAVAGTYLYRKVSAANAPATDKLWGPLVKAQGPVLSVVGSGRKNVRQSGTCDHQFLRLHDRGPEHHVSVATAVALAHVSGFLKQHGGGYEIKEDNEATLADLRSRPMILIGATNNA